MNSWAWLPGLAALTANADLSGLERGLGLGLGFPGPWRARWIKGTYGSPSKGHAEHLLNM